MVSHLKLFPWIMLKTWSVVFTVFNQCLFQTSMSHYNKLKKWTSILNRKLSFGSIQVNATLKLQTCAPTLPSKETISTLLLTIISIESDLFSTTRLMASSFIHKLFVLKILQKANRKLCSWPLPQYVQWNLVIKRLDITKPSYNKVSLLVSVFHISLDFLKLDITR